MLERVVSELRVQPGSPPSSQWSLSLLEVDVNVKCVVQRQIMEYQKLLKR